jgi:1-acyl-sn-glycerol-3-phosphate acyltransferase
MRAGVPIVPIAVVGAEEAMPIFAKSTSVARRLGLPYLPATVGYLPAKFTLRVLPPVTFDVEPGQERYSRSRVMDESEAIRGHIQDALHDMLRTRRSIWFG